MSSSRHEVVTPDAHARWRLDAKLDSAPVDGAVGTRAGTCGPGSILIRMDNGTIFQNTNTLASPTWTAR